MGRVDQLRQKLVDQFTPYASWDEFIHEKEQYERGNYQEQGK